MRIVRMSLTERIKRTSFALTMFIIITLGSVMLGITVLEIPKNQNQLHRTNLAVLGDVLSSDINNEIEDLRVLSQSPLVWTSLTDSAGRDAYLKPFLESRASVPHGLSAMLVDYRGRPLIGKLSVDLDPQALQQSFLRSITKSQPSIEVFRSQDRLLLVFVFPVLYPYTKDAIGALGGVVDLGGLVQKRTAKIGAEHGLALLQADQVLMDLQGRLDAGNFPVSLNLALTEDVYGGALTLRYYGRDNPWVMPIVSHLMAAAAAAFILGLLTWKLSAVLAKRITGRLNDLVDHCRKVSVRQGISTDDAGTLDEMDLLSRTLRTTLQAYDSINAKLEALVQDRTKQLSLSEERFRNAVEALDQPFVIFDAQDKLLYCNTKFQKEYAGIEHLIHPGQFFEVILRARLEVDHPEISTMDLEALVRDRMMDHLFGDVRVDQTRSGRWVRDIQRRTANGETVGLRVDISELVMAREQAESANIAKSQFLAMMSHELRTPLNGVIGAAQLLQSGDLDPSVQQRLIQSVLQSSEVLLNLLNDLLLFSTGDEEGMAFAPEPVQVDLLLQEIVSKFQKPALRKGLELSAHWHGEAHPCFALSRRPLWVVLEKLMDNAIKFTAKGAVSLEARLCQSETTHKTLLEFSVADTGMGIEAQQQVSIFSPFVQIDPTSTRSHGGAGVGLSIVRRLAERMGGEVGLHSDPGQGSTFWVRLPLAG
jgi:signal transduction histidine kinase